MQQNLALLSLPPLQEALQTSHMNKQINLPKKTMLSTIRQRFQRKSQINPLPPMSLILQVITD